MQRFLKSYKKFLLFLAFLLLINVIASFYYFRLDLSADKRYTLKPISKSILKSVQEPLYIKVYLDGELPAGFQHLKKTVREMLEEFTLFQPSINFEFVDIYSVDDDGVRASLEQELVQKGMPPTQLFMNTSSGKTQKKIFPYAEVRYKGQSKVVKLLVEQLHQSADEAIHQSVENVEVQLISGIRSFVDKPAYPIAFLDGNEELTTMETLDLGVSLGSFYQVKRILFTQSPQSILRYDTLTQDWSPRFKLCIIARPRMGFTPVQQYIFDQYIMRGGRVLWLIDLCSANLEEIRTTSEATALTYPLNLDGLFFKYGFRINPNMVLDLTASSVPVVTSYMAGQPIYDFMPLVYLPEITIYPNHPITQNGGVVRTEFVSSIDTLQNDIKKTILLQTSEYSRKVRMPMPVSLDILREPFQKRDFVDGAQTVGLLLEGEFSSNFKYDVPDFDSLKGFKTVLSSRPTKMVVFSDGNIVRNDFHYSQKHPLPLGFDQYTRIMYDNKDLLMNTIHYLCDEEAWMELKPRTLKMMLLDKHKVEAEKTYWQIINVVLPIFLTLLLGFIYYIYIKRRYSKPLAPVENDERYL